MSSEDLQEVFHSFCGPGHKDLDGKAFAKLIKDCGLLDRKVTPTDVDLIFAKAVQKGKRRIGFEEFEHALALVAEKKGQDPSQVRTAVGDAGGPVLHGTKAEAVRFHDDKSTYTGTHMNGGPEAVAKGEGKVPPGRVLLRPDTTPTTDRAPSRGKSPAVAAVPKIASPRPGTGTGTSSHSPRLGHGGAAAAHGGLAAAGAMAVASPRPLGSIDAAFDAFCGGQPGLDGKTFAKLCKDCGLIGGPFTATDADLVFAKVASKGARRIDVTQFRQSLEHIATKKKVSTEAVMEAIQNSRGPVLHGTHADAVRFHDDKSTYTGVHQHGGPEAVAVGAGTATQLASGGMRMGQ